MTPDPIVVVEPKPAASVMLVRDSRPGAPEPIEVYMIRRNKGMKFLGGFYAFPGGKVDPADAAAEALVRCRGVAPAEALELFPAHGDMAPLAFWVAGVRELLEESGVLLACDDAGRPVDARAQAALIESSRKALMAGEASFTTVMSRAGWHCDLRPMRYLSHFVTPKSSPIRFTARFFLCRMPPDQEPKLFTEETSEGFWIHPADGYRKYLSGEMAMAEPAEFGLAYIAQFRSVDDLWAAQRDGREKFCGVIDRIEFWKDFDWKANRWPLWKATQT
jgi:8-oxo-dGTP pyrophosphatase MutT (NUDIX family)